MQAGRGRSDLKNITFQFDKSNEMILKLNEHRKDNPEVASLIIRQLFDNACIEAGLQSDYKSMIGRINKLMSKVIDSKPKT